MTGPKCPKCGGTDWKIINPKGSRGRLIACSKCEPRQYGIPWPRRMWTVNERLVTINDAQRMGGVKSVMVYREPWGWRVVIDKPKRKGGAK